jgi:membrane protease YdiL (CAAX protease family)
MFADQAASPPAGPPPRGPEVLPRIWLTRDMWTGIAVTVGAFVVLVLAITIASSGGETDHGVGAFATLLFEVILAATVVGLAARRGLSRVDLGFVRPRRWGPLATAWVGAYVIMLAYQAALFALEAFGVPVDALGEGNAVPIDEEFGPAVIAVLGVAVVVGAPFGEELLFRGLLFRGMRGYWRLAPALATSGVLFGVFHANPSVIVPFSFVGALFAWAYEESGSLWVAIGAHAGFNGVSFALTLLLLE